MSKAVEKISLGSLPLGGRLIVRSKKDWRTAVVSRIADDRVTLSIASPSGWNYRVRREVDLSITFDGLIPVLETDAPDNWRDNFSAFDPRW